MCDADNVIFFNLSDTSSIQRFLIRKYHLHGQDTRISCYDETSIELANFFLQYIHLLKYSFLDYESMQHITGTGDTVL